ncbi:hypothetical protein FDECE_9334 [Fusarium decemcellulare]|nr:hypothetical protein FDECE_9334 [Fusarium decemcellulare]
MEEELSAPAFSSLRMRLLVWRKHLRSCLDDVAMQGFINIWWMPTANIIGRRFVFLTTLCICLSTAVWLGSFHGTAQWMLNMAINGIGTSAYQAIIQLSVFDTFFAHERGRSLGFYLFGQQLGSILGLITGGSMADTVGWRWSQYICGIIFAVVLVLFFFTFEETMFPRFLFPITGIPTAASAQDDEATAGVGDTTDSKPSEGKVGVRAQPYTSHTDGFVDEFPKRTHLKMLKPWTRYPQNKTTFWQYFRRPFFLFSFPNVVIAGFIYAFGCTAGIVSFNTISEILTSPPYNFSTTHTGFMFFAALIGNFLGWGISVLSDQLVIYLARRNGGIREPEMRLWMLVPCFFCAGGGYLLYGWGAQSGAHWITIGIGIGGMITHQVGACAIATTYAMESFPGPSYQISGELVVVLALCSSAVNFAMSYSVQPLIEAVGYGWAFVFFGGKKYVLNTGDSMPAVGLGTWQSKPGEVEYAVKWALECGYRHIDTAFAYGNEKEVGAGIKASGVPREDIWLTTKLDNDWHHRVSEAIETSLANLGTSYVDLYLMHWPVALEPENHDQVLKDWSFVDTWREMQKLVGSGKVRNIGVSNFGIRNLEKLLSAESCKVKLPSKYSSRTHIYSSQIIPAVNQIELHPFNPSSRLVEYNESKGIHTTAYSPLGSTNSPLYSNEIITSIAKAYGRTPQQILLMWGLQRGTSLLPKSVTKSRIEQNFDLDGWQLTDRDMARLSSIPDRFKVADDSWLPVRVFFGDDEVPTGAEPTPML